MKYLFLVFALMSGPAFANGNKAQDKNDKDPSNAESVTQYFDARIADHMIKSIGPIDRTQLVGRWRKVLQGPIGEHLGYSASGGIRQGGNNDALEIDFSQSNLNWIPQDVSIQLYAILKNIPTLATYKEFTLDPRKLDIRESIPAPVLLDSPVAARLEGDRVAFSMRIKYSWSATFNMIDYYYNFFGGNSTRKRSHESDSEVIVTVNYKCGLQEQNIDRMICIQDATDSGIRNNLNLNVAVMNLGYRSTFIGFERIK